MSGQSDWPWESELARVAAAADERAVTRVMAGLPMADLATLREQWLTTARHTAPLDPLRARAAIGRLYLAAGHDPPDTLAVARSPFEGLLLAATERYATGGRSGAILPDVRPSARETLGFVTAIGPALAVALWRAVAEPIYHELGIRGARFAVPATSDADPLARCLLRSILERLADGAPSRDIPGGSRPGEPLPRPARRLPLRRYVRRHAEAFAAKGQPVPPAAIWRYLLASSRPTVARAWSSLTGPRALSDAGFCAWLQAAGHLGASLSERQRAQIEVGRHCFWAWCLASCAVLVERPADVDAAALHALHRPDGPVATYRDGTGAWLWRGRPMPPAFFAPGWSVRRALRAPDVEERRCAAERIGWSPFVRRALMRRIAQNPDPANPGARLTLYGPPPWRLDRRRLLLCVNGTAEADGTRRTYGLWVPRELNCALQAAAWTYGLAPDDYASAARRA